MAILESYFGTHMSINKPQYLETLSFVSFFSDITLKTRTQIEINSQTDLDNADLDDEDTFSASKSRAILPASPTEIKYSNCRKVNWGKSYSMFLCTCND